MARPRIDTTDDDEEAVAQFAQQHGLKMSRAYAELLRIGLEEATDYENEMVRAHELSEEDA